MKLVYVGNLGEGYDLETVIAAVRKDPRHSLDIAGMGPKEKKLRLLSEGAAVRFHGYLDEAELKSLLADCDVGVIPMRDDSWVGLPYKLTDYLAAGLNVASSLHGECGELIKEKDLGEVYDFASVDSLLAALDKISGRASLPAELDAAQIYPAYVKTVMERIK